MDDVLVLKMERIMVMVMVICNDEDNGDDYYDDDWDGSMPGL